MSFVRELSYFGVCVKVRNGFAYLEVRAQSDGNSIRDLSHSSHNMFPPQGEVELRANPATTVSRGDWMAFGIESFGPPGHTKFRTVEACRLLPFEDLTDIGDPESIRHLLVEDGRAEDFPGPRYVRIGEREMVRIDPEQGRDGRWRASHETDLSALPVWEYRLELRLAINDGARAVNVVDTRSALRQIGATNWSTDAEVIRRIIGGMRAKTDSDDSARRQFAGAMLRYAEQLEHGPESSTGAPDPFAAHKILRFRRVASVLRERQDVLQEYFDFLREDPAVKELIEQKIAAAVQEETISQRASIAELLALELDREMADIRARRQAELEKSIAELGTEMMEGLERQSAERAAEVASRIAEREEEELAQLEQALGGKRAALEIAISALEDRRAALTTETATLEKKGHTLKAELQNLSEQQNRTTEIVERWTSVAAALGAGAETFAVTRTSIPALERGRDHPPQCLRFGEFEGAVAGCSLLTDVGKEMLVRLAALMLAGEVPLLHGPECDDFIEIAQSLISGGRNVRLEADPTVISFDDLWIRPGTQVSTPLRQAIAEASGESPTTQLCVISKADRSGARFWYPALADRAHRTELPPRFLVCATLKDVESDETAEFASRGILLEAKDLIAPKASIVAPAILTGPNAKVFELLVETRQTDLTSAVQLLASIGLPLGIRESQRVAQIFIAAGALMKPAQAEALARSAATRLAAATLPGRIGDNVVPLGGASRA